MEWLELFKFLLEKNENVQTIAQIQNQMNLIRETFRTMAYSYTLIFLLVVIAIVRIAMLLNKYDKRIKKLEALQKKEVLETGSDSNFAETAKSGQKHCF